MNMYSTYSCKLLEIVLKYTSEVLLLIFCIFFTPLPANKRKHRPSAKFKLKLCHDFNKCSTVFECDVKASERLMTLLLMLYLY